MGKNEIKKHGIYSKLFLIIIGGVIFYLSTYVYDETSTNEFCESCHVHPQATQTWKIGAHVYNESGVMINCVDCHLPPSGFERFTAKVSTGLRDVYGYLVKDSADFNWEQMSQRESAIHHVYQSACLNCHKNLFPPKLSRKGEDAHLYYDQNKDEIMCINCHLETGHFHEKIAEEIVPSDLSKQIYTEPTVVNTFENFTEQIPNTKIDFKMIAIPSGKFLIGSPDSEHYRKDDEGPQVEIGLSQYWIGETEVTWDEYNAFLLETGTEGRTEDQVEKIKSNKVDGITGPTPPYGNPGQGWGRGKRPAITMTHYAAEKYCEWLSFKTGKKYRLPTEAEWEYACRANALGAYFFEGNPEDYSENNFWNSIFGVDTNVINTYVIYTENSFNKTGLPSQVKPNPFGLVNTLGNVREFCSDFYSEKIYNEYKSNSVFENPTGPKNGDEYVVKGGSYKSDASDLRIAARDHTNLKAWMVTDPQIPKSLWWYSDCKDVGFRVVCEYSKE